MALTELLENAGSVFIDTAPIIYFIEAHPIYGSLVSSLWMLFPRGA